MTWSIARLGARRFHLAVLALVAALACGPAHAQSDPVPSVSAPEAEAQPNPFTFDPAEPDTLRLDGNIVRGTGAQFDETLADHRGITRLVLRGQGRTFEDAMAIARRVQQRGITTIVEPNSYCYLACGLVFLAGPERHTDGVVAVGMLLPSTTNLDRAQIGLADLVELLISFDLSPELMSALLQTRPGGVFAFSPHEIARFGVNRPATGGPPGWDATPYAVLYEHAPDGEPGTPWPSATATTHWSLGHDGDTPLIEMRAEVPERGIVMTMEMAPVPRAGQLPTFNIDFGFELGPAFNGAGIQSMVLRSRTYEGTGGITGFDRPVEIAPDRFLFELEDHPLIWPMTKVAFQRRWQSFILIYEDGDVGELLVELDDEAHAVIDTAFAAWEAMAPSPLSLPRVATPTPAPAKPHPTAAAAPAP